MRYETQKCPAMCVDRDKTLFGAIGCGLDNYLNFSLNGRCENKQCFVDKLPFFNAKVDRLF